MGKQEKNGNCTIFAKGGGVPHLWKKNKNKNYFHFFLMKASLILFSEMEDNLHIFVNSAGADGGPRSKVCSCLTLRLAPINATRIFLEDMLGGQFF